MLLETLRALELSLHDPTVRCNVEQLGALLHPSCREFGRSGVVYSRDEILGRISSAEQQPVIWAQDFAAEVLAADLAMLTYRSAQVGDGGELHRHTNRASLWQRTDSGWRLRFHQGTPTQAFENRIT